MQDKNEELNDNVNQNDNIIKAETPVTENASAESADEIAPEKTVKPENTTWKFLYPAVVLAVIAVSIAFLLAMLNSFTAPVIAERKLQEKNAAVIELFGDIKTPQTIEAQFNAPVNEIMRVYDKNDTFLGYCVSVSPKGFGGAISMLAAVNPAGEIIKIKILDMSETAGIGTKVGTDYFLEQFAGKKQEISANSGADNSIATLSGATISSKAVLNGINVALNALSEVNENGAEGEESGE